MRITIIIVAVLIGLLSIAAGAAKVALVPPEVAFLSQFGFSNALTVSYGIVQVLGGLLLLIPRTRLYGSVIAAIAFALSTGLLFAAANLTIAGGSLLPVVLAGWIAYQSLPARSATRIDGKDA